MSLFDVLSQIGTMEVHAFHDAPTGLRAMVAIHDTRLGPAIGGCRVYPYATEDDAAWDVVRLGRAMTYKAALAGLPHGGGKSIIWADSSKLVGEKRTAAFQAFGRFLDGLAGRYLTCEDSGTSAADIDTIRSVTNHCLGFSIDKGGSGDPSPWTALGVRRGIEAAVEIILGKKSLAGVHVAIQGVGSVGRHLALELHKAGAKLTIADIVPASAERVAKETGAKIVPINEVLGVECDVLAPCALGGAISDETVGLVRCKIVAGAANNQLVSRAIGKTLVDRGIFYAPDYAINAGGLINVAQEWKGYDAEASRAKCVAVYDTIAEIARRSQRTNTPPGEVADKMVEEILANAGQARPSTTAIFPSPSTTAPRGTAV